MHFKSLHFHFISVTDLASPDCLAGITDVFPRVKSKLTWMNFSLNFLPSHLSRVFSLQLIDTYLFTGWCMKFWMLFCKSARIQNFGKRGLNLCLSLCENCGFSSELLFCQFLPENEKDRKCKKFGWINIVSLNYHWIVNETSWTSLDETSNDIIGVWFWASTWWEFHSLTRGSSSPAPHLCKSCL